MTRHDDAIRLRHMLTHAIEATEMVRGRQRSDLDSDRQLNLSLVKLLEIVGKAAAHVSDAAQGRLEGIAWPDLIGLRNRLVHGYDRVDFDIMWDVIAMDLPPLIAELRRHLEGNIQQSADLDDPTH